MSLSDGKWTGVKQADRRAALRLVAGVALLPFLAHGHIARANAGLPEPSAIAPPPSPMVYRRTLERSLPGGAMFRVSRDFSVQFEEAGAGFIVSGAQLSARVDAPANLADLAALEQQRVEAGIFPLLLNGSGQIINGQEPVQDADIARALSDISQRFGSEGAEVGALVAAVHQTGTRLTAQMPRDLFAPSESPREAREEISLPWGDRGEVLMVFEAARDPMTHLMRSARRDVVTRMGDDERRSCELWELFFPHHEHL